MAGSILSGETWSFEYVPGAGDDEESWAGKLTPTLLWREREALVAAGPAGVQQLVSLLVRAAARGMLARSSTGFGKLQSKGFVSVQHGLARAA